LVSHTKEKYRLRVFENSVLRRIFGPKREKGVGGGKECIFRSFINCTLTKYYYGNQIDEDDVGGARSMDRRDEK
jgi:hypothetical protein